MAHIWPAIWLSGMSGFWALKSQHRRIAGPTTHKVKMRTSVALKMSSVEADEPQFQVVSTNTLQIRVRIPRSPSPLRRSDLGNVEDRRAPRASSVRPTRSSVNSRSSERSHYSSRSLSPRPPMASTTSRPPPPSPSNSIYLPTRAPTPPQKTCDRLLTVPTASRASPRSLSPRYTKSKSLILHTGEETQFFSINSKKFKNLSF